MKYVIVRGLIKKKTNKQMTKTSGQLLPSERPPLYKLYLMNNRDFKIEVFWHFPRTANVKRLRDQCLAVRFAV